MADKPKPKPPPGYPSNIPTREELGTGLAYVIGGGAILWVGYLIGRNRTLSEQIRRR